MLRRFAQPLWIALAIIFLIEAWLWDHLEPVVARIVGLIPLHAIKRWLAARVGSLSPAMSLIVFAVPAVLLFPLKIVGLWLVAHKYWFCATLTVLFAKLAGVGVTAFVFDVTRPKLLQMAWFERLYRFILAMRAKAREIVAPVMERIRAAMTADRWSRRMLRLVLRFRKRIHEARTG